EASSAHTRAPSLARSSASRGRSFWPTRTTSEQPQSSKVTIVVLARMTSISTATGEGVRVASRGRKQTSTSTERLTRWPPRRSRRGRRRDRRPERASRSEERRVGKEGGARRGGGV